MTREEFIFTKQFPQRLYRHILFWLVFYFYTVLTYFHDGLDKIGFKKWYVLEISENFFHVLTQMIFCYIVLYVLYPLFLVRKKYFLFIAGLAVLGVGVFWLYYFEHIFFFKMIHTHAGLPFRPPDVVYWFTMISLFTYFPVSAALAVCIKVLKNFYVKLQQNQLLTRENADAELQLLKAQVHPHFLFNTLNNIYAFTLNKSMQAPQLLMNLSNTLHYMITECESDMVPLDKELKMLQDYTDLEKVRYGNRLDIKFKISGDVSGKKITPLLMIPFIENSFKHGASKMLRDPWLNLFIQVDENMLHFTLANNKPPEEQPAGKGGIGLKNVQKRLELIFPSTHLLTIESTSNTFTVNMQVPIQKINEAEQYKVNLAKIDPRPIYE